MARIQIDTSMLLAALQDHGDTVCYYLDARTGEVMMLPSIDVLGDLPEEDDLRETIEAAPKRYRFIEPVDSGEAFRIMEQFADGLPEGRDRDDLLHALGCPRPFRRFKDVLVDYPEVEESWFEYNDRELKEIARRWLQDKDIDAELLPLPGKTRSPREEKKRSILSKQQIDYLSAAFDYMHDMIKDDIRTLATDPDAMEDLWLWHELPPIGRAELDLNMTFKLLASLVALVYRFHTDREFTPGSRAEDVLLHIATQNAEAQAEMEEREIDDFDTFRSYIYQDLDFLMMYEQEFDGIDDSPIGDLMGIASFSPKDWFVSRGEAGNAHPFFLDGEERLRFPANRRVAE